MEFIAEAVELTRNAACPGDFDQVWELVVKATENQKTASGLGFTMVRSLDPVERKIGFDLLGSLAQIEESLREPVLFACLELVALETDGVVQAAIARTLGCTADERAVPTLLRLADHPAKDVREYVASSLPMTGETSEAVIEVLIRLSCDPEDDVRNWATFALGTQCQADGTAIREALWARVHDGFSEVREEAIAGLARRRDHRIVPHVERVLASGSVSGSMLTAIACLGDPALVPYLEDYEDEVIVEALRECDPETRAVRDAFAADLTEALHAGMPDLEFGLYAEVCEPGLVLSLYGDTGHWSVEPLCERAGGDPVRAADLVVGHLQSMPLDASMAHCYSPDRGGASEG